VAENVPQLFVGALGGVGKTAMALSNAGYAADYYQQGIEQYAKDHDGQLPSKDEMGRIGMWAASLAVAEHLGDHISLGAALGKDSTKTAFKNSLRAATQGVVGEGATETFQTYAEGEASGKPASLLDIYKGGVIGASSGGVLSGGGRAVAEASRATPEHAAEHADQVQQAADFQQAVAENNPAPYFDPSHTSYDPATGLGVLFAVNQKEDTTPEVKQQNLDQAVNVITGLEDRFDSLKEQLKSVSKEEIPALNAELSKVSRYLKESDSVLGELTTQLEPAPAPAEIKATVEQANTADAEVSAPAAERVLNLAMRNVDTLTKQDADALAGNTDNALTPAQRDYLRTFSAARVADNQLATMEKVSQEVLHGSKKNIGITQYRQRIGTAIASGSAPLAQRQLGMLSDFAADHAGKAAAAAQALSQNGLGAQIVKLGGKWQVADREYSQRELNKLKEQGQNGMTLNSGRLVRDIQIEAQALAAARDEMTNAVALRFPDAGVQSISPAPVVAQENKQGEVSKELTGQRVKDLPRSESKASEGESAPQVPVKETKAKDSLAAADEKHARQDALVKEALAKAAARKAEKQAAVEDQAQPERAPQTPPLAADVQAEATADKAVDNTVDKSEVIPTAVTPESEQAKPYQQRDLLLAHFTQKAGKDTGSTRPLVQAPGFLASLKADVSAALQYLKEPTLTEQQHTALSTFASLASDWVGNIATNFVAVANPLYRYRDMSQFLIGTDGKVAANTQTAIAYAAFSWLAENANRTLFNTDEEINAILGRDEDALVSQEAAYLLRGVGTRENVVINALGSRVAQALGLTARPDAPRNLAPQLESALGAHAMKLLLDQGILVRNTLSGKDMASVMPKGGTNENATFKFIAVVAEQAQTKQILEAMKGSQGVLDKLFGAEQGLKEPAFRKIPFTQQTTRNTDQTVPSSEKAIMQHENAQPNHLRLDMWHLFGQLHPDMALAIAGFESINPTVTHEVNQKSIEAKNDGLRREYERAMEYFGMLQDQDVLEKAMYFDHTVWKQQRVGISTNMINPQTSKLHRRLLFRPTWEVELQMSDRDGMENFKLRVAEGLGIKTDKQSNEQSLEQLTATVNQPEIKRAVAVLRKAMTEGGISAEEQQQLVAGVQKGGEAMHTLDALVALAHYLNALDEGKNTFTTHLMGEVDGVTNGPMLSHLLMGAAETVEDLYALLNKGGFYEEGSDHSNYNLWRAEDGNTDLYETTTAHVVENLRNLQIPAGQANALYTLTGHLVKDDKVTKDGRNIIKTPLTAMVFGSSVSSAVESMADKFIESVYGKMEDVATGKLDQAVLLASLKTLGVNLGNPSIEEMMKTPLTPAQIGRLKQVFTDTIGKAVGATMDQDFEVFIRQRRTFNLSAQLAFDLYHAAYTGLREQKIAELVKAGAIAVDGKGNPIHDLTNAQEAELRVQVQDILPLMHTAFSQQSGELSAGLLASKSARKISTDRKYSGEIKFGQPFPDGPASVKTAAYERSETAPGVAMAPMSVHATDSFISHTAAMKSEVLNNHDAHTTGLGNFKEAAVNLNQATWQAMLSYSPASQMADTLTRVIRGVAAMQEAGTLPPQSQALLQEVLAKYAAQLDTKPGAVLDIQAKAMRDLAYRADSMKFLVMEKMGAVDQYALQGGHYVVTEADRKAVKKARRALDSSLSSADNQALAILSALASGVKNSQTQPDTELDVNPSALPSVRPVAEVTPLPGPFTSPWGELGAPAVISDAYLVDAFNQDPVMDAKLAVKTLRQALSNGEGRMAGFNNRLLDLIEKTLPKDVQVQLITPATPASAVLANGAEESRGWFVAKGDRKQVNLLSPDFKYSGLTPETMLHELTHAAIATTVEQALQDKTGPAYELVQELELLRALAQSHVTQNKLKGFTAALENVHEFISWGMSNLDFQRSVLNQISMQSNTTGNKLVTGMKRFIEALTGLLFKGSSKTAQEQMENGMAVLVANVSGLFYQAAQTKSKAELVLHQKNQPNLNTYSTLDIYDALGQVNPVSPVSAAFQVQLKGLLTGIVDTLHGPFGTFKAALMQNQASTPAEVFANALQSGVAPFASKSLAAGFRISEQEAYVLEQVEATVRAALEDKEGHTTLAYEELAKLYQEAATRLQGQMPQALYDFVFKLEAGADGKSDYLARFAALGLAHEETANLLNFATQVKTKQQLAGLTLADKLHAVYDMVLAFLSRTFTHTFEGQQADAKLEALVTQLVGIEAKKRMKLGQQRNTTMALIEDTLHDLSEGGRSKLEDFLKSPFFKTNTNAFIKAAGSVGAAIAGDRADLIMEGIAKIRDEHFRQRHGPMAGIINEIRGSKPDNVLFHKLLRASKHIEGLRKDIIANTTKFILESFKDGGNYLSKEDKAAISAVFLRTDLASLVGQYGMHELGKLIANPGMLQKEIARLEGQLTGFANFGHYFVKGAKLLGYYKATGRVAGANLMFNAGNISLLYGTQFAGRIAPAMAAKAEPVIDKLVSLYALAYVDQNHLANAQAVLATENARTDGNGIEMILKLHKQLQQQSKDRLFVAGEPLYMKGYVPEAYNPYISIVAADQATGEQLVNQGYSEGAALHADKVDPDKSAKRLYKLQDGGLQSYLTGVFSYTGTRAKGSQVISGGTNLLTSQGLANVTTMQTIDAGNVPRVRDMFNADPNFDPRKVGGAFLAPVLNAQGDVVNYRYMMNENTKDTLLERDNRFEQLLGKMAGNIFDKEMTKEQNATAVQALKDQYDAEYATRHHSYLRVGANSTDPELREIWRLLPESTKQSVRDIWGGNNMMVRVDLLDINFGYRKLSIADVLDKDVQQHSAVARVLAEMATFFFGDKANLRLRQGEDIWQAFVREAKDTMVVKSGVTLMGNISSNMTELLWFGVPLPDILRHHRVAMKGALAYRKDSEALERINLQLSTKYLPAGNQRELERQKVILEDALARNPVRQLIDAGLMPTIVEDVAADDDMYSFKGRFTRKVDEFTDKLNPHVVDTAKTLVIAHDTPLYKALSYGTQLSDFVARYTLYQHMTNRARNPMGTEQAIQLVSDAFINYDVPSHRLLQYANDMGFVYFSKYYLRIQKIIMHLYRENPARALMLLIGSHFFDAVPTLMDSAAVHRLGNPFSTGALKYVTTLDELGTVNALMSPFK
jgi:hypothetical protein